MPFVCPNLVFETTTVEGTGVATLLGAVGDFLDFDSQLADNDTVPYTIEFGAVKEVGLGVFNTSGTTLTRTSILFSTNGDAAVDFAAGTKNVYSGIPGELLESLTDSSGSNGFLAQTTTHTYARRTFVEGNGITITNESGAAGNPTIATTFRRVEEFGAVEGIGQETANNTAFAAIETYLATTDAAAVVFSEGIWVWDTDINWAQADFTQVLGHGVVRLRYTGTGTAFNLDGGAAGGGIFAMKVGPFIIEAPSTATDGAYIRAMHHCNLDLNVRGCGATNAAFHLLWCVANRCYFTSSVNEDGGWYTSAQPYYGIVLAVREEQSSYNTFINPLMEGQDVGIHMSGALGNTFYTGAIEGCLIRGLEIIDDIANSNNKFYGTDFEKNGPAEGGPDIYCDSRDNEFHGVDTFADFVLGANAINNKIIGGAHREITLTAGAASNILTGFTIDRFGNSPAGEVSGDKDVNIVRDYTDNAGTLITLDGLTLNPTSLPNEVVISEGPTSSPHTYTNNNDRMEMVGVLPSANVTSVEFIRNTVGESISLTWGAWPLAPGDGISVTFPDATGPKIVSWPYAR